MKGPGVIKLHFARSNKQMVNTHPKWYLLGRTMACGVTGSASEHCPAPGLRGPGCKRNVRRVWEVEGTEAARCYRRAEKVK